MDAFMFVLKSFIVTVLVIMALQVKVGTYRIEDKLSQTVRDAGVLDLAQDFANSSSRLVRNTWTKFVGGVNSTFEIDRRGEGAISFDRSRAYLKEKAERAKQAVQEQFEEKRTEAKRKIDETAYSR